MSCPAQQCMNICDINVGSTYLKQYRLCVCIIRIPLYELPATIDRPIAIAYLCIAFRENPMRRTLFHAKNSHKEAEPAPYII